MKEPKINIKFEMKKIAGKEIKDINWGENERKSLEKFIEKYAKETEKYLKNHHITGVIAFKIEYD